MSERQLLHVFLSVQLVTSGGRFRTFSFGRATFRIGQDAFGEWLATFGGFDWAFSSICMTFGERFATCKSANSTISEHLGTFSGLHCLGGLCWRFILGRCGGRCAENKSAHRQTSTGRHYLARLIG